MPSAGRLAGPPTIEATEDQLQITFSGEVLGQINELARELRSVSNGAEVVIKALVILLKARGCEMILKNKHSGEAVVVDLWE